MKVISKSVLLALVCGLLTFGVGCAQEGLPPGMSPEDVIKEALMKETTKSIFEMNMKADLEGKVDGEQNTLDGTMNLSGTTDKDAEIMQLVFNVDGTMNEESLTIEFELRANEDGVFAKVGTVNVSDEDTQELLDVFLEEYLGEWIKLSFMEQEELVESGYGEIHYEKDDVFPFKNLEYKGTVDVLGLKSYHFTAEVDEEVLLSMMETGDVAEAEQFFGAAEMYGDVYVSVNDLLLTGFDGTMELDDPEMNGTIEFSFKMNPTKANAVSTPDYTQELTEEDLASLMFGGAMMGPGTGEMEMEFDEDFDYSQFEELEGMEDFDFEAMPPIE